MKTPDPDNLIGAIYDAALDRARWPAALERMRHYVGVTAIHFMAVDRRLGLISFSATANVSQDAELEYVRRYCAIDPRVRVLLAGPVGPWLHCNELLDEAFVARDPFYQGLIIPNGLRYLAGRKVYEDDHLTVVLGLFHGLGLPPVSRAQTVLADALVPHLERAIRLSLSRYLYSSQALVGVEIVNRLRYPVFLLKSDGEVVHMNTAARQVLIDRDTPLCIEAERLSCNNAAGAQRIDGALRCFQEGPTDTLPSLPVSRPAAATQILSLERRGKRPLKGFISPLHPEAVLGVFGPQRLMMAAFSDPGRNVLPEASFLMAAYGLTPAEARVAAQVALGKSIKQTAQELRVQPTTVRTQLDNVFRKTGTGKQSEMVAELLSLPDMRVEGLGRVELN
ncbi:MAG TPA: helix-turn-helix transcriptional regulator [Burkholderiales bacterium]